MQIDGKGLANQILQQLKNKIDQLKKSGVEPALAVILVGDNPASLSYIRQKQAAAQKIGVSVILEQISAKSPRLSELLNSLIAKYNSDPAVNALIIQRPLPPEIDGYNTLLQEYNPNKDVDGFLPGSPYPAPVAAAVMKILRNIYKLDKFDQLVKLLKSQIIVVIGRGETAGRPIAQLLEKSGAKPIVVHSQTPNPDHLIKSADLVISCVGRPNVVHINNIKPGAGLISVGIFRDAAGKLHGDYDEPEIAKVASFYTPTPGGVGPVNVACLMDNVVTATENFRVDETGRKAILKT